MIQRISLSNFKSWKSIKDREVSSLTGLFGTNSSGKTSIIQFFLLLKQTIESSDRTQVINFGSDKDYVSLGSYKDIIFQHNQEQIFSFDINFGSNDNIIIYNTEEKKQVLFSEKNMSFSSSISETKSKRLYINSLTYGISGHKFMMKKEEKDKYDYRLSSTTLDPSNKKYNLHRTPGRVWPLP